MSEVRSAVYDHARRRLNDFTADLNNALLEVGVSKLRSSRGNVNNDDKISAYNATASRWDATSERRDIMGAAYRAGEASEGEFDKVWLQASMDREIHESLGALVKADATLDQMSPASDNYTNDSDFRNANDDISSGMVHLERFRRIQRQFNDIRS